MTPAALKNHIERIVNVFETGTPQGDYGQVQTYLDGHDGTRQITYGRSQTTEQSNLRDLIALYIQLEGKFADLFQDYVNLIGRVPLAENNVFKSLLRTAGEDPIMRQAEDQFFDFDYWQPAMAWAQTRDFLLPLSWLVIYDSFIHSGGVPNFLRNRFAEKPPVSGGEEKIWITNYVDVRHNWLRTYNDPRNPEKSRLLRLTCYRTGDLKRAIQGGNWDMEQLPFIANGEPVYLAPVDLEPVSRGDAKNTSEVS